MSLEDSFPCFESVRPNKGDISQSSGSSIQETPNSSPSFAWAATWRHPRRLAH